MTLLRGALVTLAFLLPLTWFAAAAMAQKKIALVIGNAAYKEAPLKNPVNDARAMAAKLRQLGFQVIAQENATKA
ncbi:MAG: caspase family protein, partial [Rhodospirillales bacterium]|nr:caspase family protein [Rhodospirillales bacterium]